MASRVAVAVVEAAERAVDVGVDVAEQLALHDQQGDEMAALGERAPAPSGVWRRLTARLRRASSSHGVTVSSSACSSSPVGTSDPPMREALRRVRRFQHQQHALGAGQLRHFVDEELVRARPRS